MMTAKYIVHFIVYLLSSIVIIDTYAGNPRPSVLDTLSPNSTFIVKKDIDLHGHSFQFPEGVTIIQKKGSFINGTLIGNGTILLASGKNVFNNVDIKGTWNVKEISSSLFSNMSDDRLFENINNMQTSQIHNHIILEDRRFDVSIGKENGYVLFVEDNATIEFKGDIYLQPNSLKYYSVVMIRESDNIKLLGGGSIVGDRNTHLGETGEWGMGISIYSSHNIDISGIAVKSFWGDGIYVAKSSERVKIYDLNISGCRRQGISLVGCKNVIIKDCSISNIKGTAPGYGIDLEPNPDQNVDSVLVHNITIKGCNGGVQMGAGAKNTTISNIVVEECQIYTDAYSEYPLNIVRVDNVYIVKCDIISNNKGCKFWHCGNVTMQKSSVIVTNDEPSIVIIDNDDTRFDACTLKTKGLALSSLKNVRINGCNITCKRLSPNFIDNLFYSTNNNTIRSYNN